jgi:hypothetical protein
MVINHSIYMLFNFFKIIITIYFLIFIFINCLILINSEKIIKYTIIKIEKTFDDASQENLLKLQKILDKFNVKIEYKNFKEFR